MKKRDAVKCANPACGQKIVISQWRITPPAETPADRIHTIYDPTTFSFSMLCKHCAHFSISSSTPDAL